MYPYKPRNPAFGTRLRKLWIEKQQQLYLQKLEKEGKPLPSLDEIPSKYIDVSSFYKKGGPVEEAIAQDLHSFSLKVISTWSQTQIQHNYVTSESGFAFKIFKTVYHNCRFGLIHHHCPPRCDLDAYAQLLYSSCFFSIETNFVILLDSLQKDEKNQSQFHQTFLSVAFYLFTLYTLHQTSPLPSLLEPGLSSNPSNAKSNGRNVSNENKDIKVKGKRRRETMEMIQQNSVTNQYPRILDMLPLNIQNNNIDPKATIFRRCYKAPIRIGRRQMLIVQQIRDLSLSLIASSYIFESSIFSPNEINEKLSLQLKDITQNQFQCIIAKDIIEICDRMQNVDNKILDYCEYPGPGTLDGFVASVWFQQNKKDEKILGKIPSLVDDKRECININYHSDQSEIQNREKTPMQASKSGKQKNWISKMESALDLSGFQEYMNAYQKTIQSISLTSNQQKENEELPKFFKRTKLQTSLQSRQDAIVKQILLPLLTTHKKQSNMKKEDFNNSMSFDKHTMYSPYSWDNIYDRLRQIIHASKVSECKDISFLKDEQNQMQYSDRKGNGETNERIKSKKERVAIGTTARILQEKYRSELNANTKLDDRNPPLISTSDETLTNNNLVDDTVIKESDINVNLQNKKKYDNKKKHLESTDDDKSDAISTNQIVNERTSNENKQTNAINYCIKTPSTLSHSLQRQIQNALLSRDPMKEIKLLNVKKAGKKPQPRPNHAHKVNKTPTKKEKSSLPIKKADKKPSSKNKLAKQKKNVEQHQDIPIHSFKFTEDDLDEIQDSNLASDEEEKMIEEFHDDYSLATAATRSGQSALSLLLKLSQVGEEHIKESIENKADEETFVSELEATFNFDASGNSERYSEDVDEIKHEKKDIYFVPRSEQIQNDEKKMILNQNTKKDQIRTSSFRTHRKYSANNDHVSFDESMMTHETGQGRAALDQLLIEAKKRIPTADNRMFIVNRTKYTSKKLRDSCTNDDDMSMADTVMSQETGQGRSALNKLLIEVKNKPNSDMKARKSATQNNKIVDTVMSHETGQGRSALNKLLTEANNNTNTDEKRKSKRISTQYSLRKRKNLSINDDDISIADTVSRQQTGQGRSALNKLLTEADNKLNTNEERKSKKNRMQYSNSDGDISVADTAMSHETGQGRSALNKLLRQASHETAHDC